MTIIIAKVKIYEDGVDAGYRTIKITRDHIKELAENLAYEVGDNEGREASFAETEVLTNTHNF
jgi:hypothetical protein